MCTLSLNKLQTFHSPGCDVAVSPQLFVFLFLILSGLCHIHICRSTMHPELITKNKNDVNITPNSELNFQIKMGLTVVFVFLTHL